MSARERLVAWAKAQVGKPYDTYRDCSGFTAAAYRQVGITIPEGSVAQYAFGEPVDPDVPLRTGDLLFWDTYGPAPGHVALHIGNGDIVHALNERRGIVLSRLSDNMGGPYMGARCVLVLWEDAPADDDTDAEPTDHPKHRRRRKRRHRREDRS